MLERIFNGKPRNKLPQNLLKLRVDINRMKNAIASFPLALKTGIISKAMNKTLLNESRFINSLPNSDNDWIDWRYSIYKHKY